MSSLISKKKVSPRGVPGAPLLIIGEAPGFEEDRDGIAFVGDAGDDLNRAMKIAGIQESEAYIMNLCNYRPPNNDFDYLRDTPELAEGLKEINEYIDKNRSQIKLILLLGREPLRYILGKMGDGAITNWRGSFINRKDLTIGVAYHPAYITRQRQLFPILCHDFRRAKVVLSEGFNEPQYNFRFDPKGFDLEESLREIEAAEEISLDIETRKKDVKFIKCLGVGLSSSKAVIFWNHSLTGLDPVFRQTYERVLASKAKKVYHNGYSFDTEVQYLHSLSDQIDYDTMIAANSLNPEFPIGLDFLVSIYTWQSCYWDDSGADEKMHSDKTPKETLMDYCGKDCCTLFTIKEKQLIGYMQIDGFKQEPLMLEDYRYKMSMIPVAKHIGRAGMPRDMDRVKLIREAVDSKIQKDMTLYCAIAGKHVNPNGKIVLRQVLFDEFKLPIKKDRKTGEITTGEDAIVSLIGHCQEKISTLKTPELKFEWQKKLVFLKLTLQLRGNLKLKSSYIDIDVSEDGRVRSTYKIPGTETNRWSCALYVDQTGWNAQTLPREVMEYEANTVTTNTTG